MKRFRNILMVLPPGELDASVLEWGRHLAGASEAAVLRVLRCIESPLPEYGPGLEDAMPVGDPGDCVEAEREQIAPLIAAALPGVATAVDVETGDVLRQVLGYLAEGTFDLVLIAMGDEAGRHLAERLARKSPVGVLALPPGSGAPPRRILAAIDFSDLSPLVLDWAEAFTALAPSTAEKLCLHVMRFAFKSFSSVVTRETLEQAHRLAAGRHLRHFLEQNKRRPSDWEALVADGDFPAAAIVREAARARADLLVVGGYGKNAISDLLIGSTTAELVRRSAIPILVVKRKNKNLDFLRKLLGTQG